MNYKVRFDAPDYNTGNRSYYNFDLTEAQYIDLRQSMARYKIEGQYHFFEITRAGGTSIVNLSLMEFISVREDK